MQYEVSTLNALLFTVKPVVLLDQNDVHGDKGNDNLTISPIINFGIPKATVTWSRNGQALNPNNPRVSISSGGVLTVTGVQATDTGVYTVTASNIAVPEGVMASVNVSISCKCTCSLTTSLTIVDNMQYLMDPPSSTTEITVSKWTV